MPWKSYQPQLFQTLSINISSNFSQRFLLYFEQDRFPYLGGWEWVTVPWVLWLSKQTDRTDGAWVQSKLMRIELNNREWPFLRLLYSYRIPTSTLIARYIQIDRGIKKWILNLVEMKEKGFKCSSNAF